MEGFPGATLIATGDFPFPFPFWHDRSGSEPKSNMQKRRTIVIFLILSLLFLALLAQLVNVQVINHEYYVNRSDNKQTRIELLRPLRGKITDRNGTVLARNRREYDLYVVPDLIEDRDQFFERLAGLTRYSKNDLEKNYREILRRINARAEQEDTKREVERRRRGELTRSHRLVKYLTFEQAREIRTNNERYRGALVRGWPTRTYPHGRFAGHITGYVQEFQKSGEDEEKSEYEELEEDGFFREGIVDEIGKDRYRELEERGAFLRDVIGRRGLEKHFDRRLRGEPGAHLIERDLESGTSRTLQTIPPENGRDVRTTIDIQAQRAAVDVLKNRTGAFVLLDAENGDLLALTSSPGYDPNLLIPPVSSSDLRKVFTSSGASRTMNRAIEGRYPPGSAFKIFVALVGLETDTIQPSTEIQCGGKYHYKNNTYKCWIYDKIGSGHGNINVTEAIQQSCNIFFYRVGLSIGYEKLKEWQEKLRLLRAPELPLSNVKEGNFFKPHETVIGSIGQASTIVTPLQLTRLTALVASGSPITEPNLVLKPEPNRTREVNPDIEKSTLKAIRQGMHNAVNTRRGTAYRAEELRSKDLSYSVSGKTSTAEMAGDEEDHAWFTGFAPSDDPKVAFSIIIEHGGSGGKNAAPLVGKILSRIDLPEK